MKKIFILMLAIVLISGMASLSEAELLINGDAEQGDTSGWNNLYPLAIKAVEVAQADKPLAPFDGDYFFSFSEVRIGPDNSVSMSQRGFLTDDAKSIRLTGYFATEFQDFGEATISIYDSSDNVLTTGTGPLFNDPVDFIWTPFEISLPVPANATYWQVELKGTVNYGGHANVYWDNISLTSISVPEPCPEDTTLPSGAVHAYPNSIWPPNNKMVTVTLDGRVMDEISAAREGGGHGVSSAYLMIDGTDKIILIDGATNLLDTDGYFNVDIDVKATGGSEYLIELFAADKNPGSSNSGLVDTTYIRVPRDMSGEK